MGGPPCPHCGEPPNRRELAETEAKIDEARRQALAEAEREWAGRTPEQDAAYNAGRAAFAPGSGVTSAMKANPYSPRNCGQPDHPLRGWWGMGWHAAEYDSVRPEGRDK